MLVCTTLKDMPSDRTKDAVGANHGLEYLFCSIFEN